MNDDKCYWMDQQPGIGLRCKKVATHKFSNIDGFGNYNRRQLCDEHMAKYNEIMLAELASDEIEDKT